MIQEQFDKVYKQVYFFMLVFIVAMTFVQAINGVSTFVYFSPGLENMSVQAEEFISQLPEEYTENILFFSFQELCVSSDDGKSYYFGAVVPDICIDVDKTLPPYYWKASVYHELGHHVWGMLNQEQKAEYEAIYLENNATGWLTSTYAEKSVTEGFAEDFMYYHLPMALYGPLASNSEKFLNKTLAELFN